MNVLNMGLPVIVGILSIIGGSITILDYYLNKKKCPRCTKRIRIKNKCCRCSCGNVFYV